ncbi:MAG: Nramp family divalent metal transporter [Acidobacteria bacterium]|nr:Nramp family divalent metal transporter [Acidobacteriota bacterium]
MVPVPAEPGWRRWFAVAGPALMVSVGYMDPGNWATDLAGGSRYEYRLLWVLLMSNLMAVLLQSLSARLGIIRRRDLAQASREVYPRAVNLPLYGLAEVAICACDLAEVIGSAIALKLLFGLPLLIGVVITTVDVLFLLALMRFGIRKLEALIVSLVGTIAVAFAVETILARPDWGSMALGFVPGFPDGGALYIAIGILGATVMPHNLYLHSALVQTRRFSGGPGETRRAIRANTLDSTFALNLAFFVNAAILVLAAAVFYRHGYRDVAEIQDAHRLLEPLLGAAIAPIAFAVALLASGQSSTVTGTLAGQIVMEGYLDLRIRPWLRRILTRVAAVVPAILTIVYFGEDATGDLLVLSQVVLSLQLPFATIPLIHFVSDRKAMGEHAIGPVLRILAWATALVIVGLNVWLVVQTANGWIASGGAWATALILPFGVAIVALLAFVTFQPWLARRRKATPDIHHGAEPAAISFEAPAPVRKVAIALDFSGHEEKLIREALRHLGASRPELALLHVVESAPARAFGREAADKEMRADAARLEEFARALRNLGYTVATGLGAGAPARELARLVGEFGAELVILGGHGHRGLSDMLHGTTAEALRHRVHASVLVIPLGAAE